jgi:hypothetical protein
VRNPCANDWAVGLRVPTMPPLPTQQPSRKQIRRLRSFSGTGGMIRTTRGLSRSRFYVVRGVVRTGVTPGSAGREDGCPVKHWFVVGLLAAAFCASIALLFH